MLVMSFRPDLGIHAFSMSRTMLDIDLPLALRYTSEENNVRKILIDAPVCIVLPRYLTTCRIYFCLPCRFHGLPVSSPISFLTPEIGLRDFKDTLRGVSWPSSVDFQDVG